MDEFNKQLPDRIQATVNRQEREDYFPLYVRLMRKKQGLDRKALTIKAALPEGFISFLENNLLRPDELTPEIRLRIEKALGISYQDFKTLNEPILKALQSN